MNEKRGRVSRSREPKSKHRYIFPNPLAKLMKDVDTKTQFESSMMSMALLMIGMVLMSVYTLIYLDQGLIFKFFLVLNLIAGFIFMSSFLVTTYQQYYSYMDAMEIQGITPGTEGFGPKVPSKKNRKNQFLFFGGIIILLIGCASFFFKSGAGFLYDYKNYISLGCLILGALMCSLVFRKNKAKADAEKLEEEKASAPSYNRLLEKVNKVKPQQAIIYDEGTEYLESTEINQEEIAALMEDVNSGLATLRTLDKTPDNESMRTMITEAIKAKMDDIKKMKGGMK